MRGYEGPMRGYRGLLGRIGLVRLFFWLSRSESFGFCFLAECFG